VGERRQAVALEAKGALKMTALEIARQYVVQRGWSVVPVPFRSKNPGFPDWQKLRLTEATLATRFNGCPQNVGILLGAPSDWLIDVDLDHSLAVKLAPLFLPTTGAVFGRPGKPRSHWIFRVSAPVNTKQHEWKNPATKKTEMIVELRSTGTQTVFPGSVHESGEPIEWCENGEPAIVDPDELVAAVERIAETVLAELGEFKKQTPAKTRIACSEPPDRERVLSALAALSLSRADSRGDWIRVGMALHSFDDSLLAEWDRWSQQSSKYREGEPARKWQSFHRSGVTVRSLFWMAIENGWKPPRATNIATPAKLGAQGGDSRPEIVVTTDEHVVNDAALEALAKDENVFQRGGRLVSVVRGGRNSGGIDRPKDAPRIAELKVPVLREVLTRTARFVKIAETKDWRSTVSTHPPDWCAKALFDRGNYEAVRLLDGVVESPVLRPDGSILNRPGYDAETGLLFEPIGSMPTIPSSPSRHEALAARDLLADLVQDFPFEHPSHRSVWFAALLTVLARRAFGGPAPLFLFDANVPGSGKTLLAELISLIVTGREIARMTCPDKDEECRKRITAIVLGGDELVLMDNAAGSLGCPSLDAALTGTVWKDRRLTRSEIVTGPLSVTWLASGNNVAVRGDTARRTAHCRLNSPDENPEERTGFKYADIRGHVRLHRTELLAAALTILRAYYVADRPKADLKPWGSFEGWSDLVRHCLVWIEMEDPGATREELRRSSDQDSQILPRLVEGLAQSAADGCTTAKILGLIKVDGNQVLRDAVHELCGSTPDKPPDVRKLGNKLRQYRERIVRGRYIAACEDRKGLAIWKVMGADSAGSADSYTDTTRARTHTRTKAHKSRHSLHSRQSGANPVTRIHSNAEGLAVLDGRGMPTHAPRSEFDPA
jgi:hypothetical protein